MPLLSSVRQYWHGWERGIYASMEAISEKARAIQSGEEVGDLIEVAM
jgi:hypothetical protein